MTQSSERLVHSRDAKRQKKIDELIRFALDLPPQRWSSFLDAACGADAELRADVESYLTKHQESQTLTDCEATGGLRQVDHFKIESLLGSGGMGEVYLATDKLGRKVAVKLLAANLGDDQQYVARFLREAQAVLTLNHPNIVTIYDIAETNGSYCIASEFIEGETLRDRMKRGRIPLADVLRIAIQIASGLVAAHNKGIVHRDIKPENVMIRADSYIKILDFGIAKLTEEHFKSISADAPTALRLDTAEGMIVGTAPYMSPEQARGFPVDVRTDIWSFGVVVYEMLSEINPFSGGTTSNVLAGILTSKPPALRALNPEIPEDLETIVAKALSKDRADRYQTVNDLLAELRQVKKRLEFDAEVERKFGVASLERPSFPFLRMTGEEAKEPESTNSIAVLPFVNLSSEVQNEYFCDGLAEDLLNALTKIEHLKVAARTSSFSFKGKTAGVAEIGSLLGVKTVLEGSVRRAGDRLRINLQLVNAADGYHLWSERYDREMKDIFEVQDEITLAVVAALKVKLLGAEKASVLKRYTKNTEAYDLYLKGRYFWLKFNPEGWTKALECFEQAIKKDPSLALAYSGLSDALMGLGVFTPPKGVYQKAKETVLQALKLDPSVAEIWCSKGAVRFFHEWDWAGTMVDCQRALQLNPRYPLTHDLYSLCLVTVGRFDEAIAEARKACELEPLSAYLHSSLGSTLFLAHRFEEATQQLQKGEELDSSQVWSHMWQVDLFEHIGDFAQALIHRQKLLALIGNNQFALEIGQEFERSGYQAVLRKCLEDLYRQSRSRYVPPLSFAKIYMQLGEEDRALDWLEKACDDRTMFLSFVKVSPTWEAIHDHPRYLEILRRMRLLNNDNSSLRKTSDPVRESTAEADDVKTALMDLSITDERES